MPIKEFSIALLYILHGSCYSMPVYKCNISYGMNIIIRSGSCILSIGSFDKQNQCNEMMEKCLEKDNTHSNSPHQRCQAIPWTLTLFYLWLSSLDQIYKNGSVIWAHLTNIEWVDALIIARTSIRRRFVSPAYQPVNSRTHPSRLDGTMAAPQNNGGDYSWRADGREIARLMYDVNARDFIDGVAVTERAVRTRMDRGDGRTWALAEMPNFRTAIYQGWLRNQA